MHKILILQLACKTSRGTVFLGLTLHGVTSVNQHTASSVICILMVMPGSIIFLTARLGSVLCSLTAAERDWTGALPHAGWDFRSTNPTGTAVTERARPAQLHYSLPSSCLMHLHSILSPDVSPVRLAV